jgi:hypothetical protein
MKKRTKIDYSPRIYLLVKSHLTRAIVKAAVYAAYRDAYVFMLPGSLQ